MKTSLRLLSAFAALAAACSPGTEETGAPRSETATLDQRFADVAARAPAFGGLFLSEAGEVSVLVTDSMDRERTVAAIAHAFPEYAGVTPRWIEGAFPFQQLHAWHEAMIDVLADDDVAFTDLDEVRNRVFVGVTAGDAIARVEQHASGLGIPREALIVEVVDPIVNYATLRDQIRPLQGGLQIRFSGYLCTLGFPAVRGGVAGFVTNSHCTDSLSVVDGTLYYQPLNQVASEFVGTEIADPAFFTGSGCPKGRQCRYSDAAYVELASGVSNSLGTLSKTTGANNGSLTLNGTFSIQSEQSGNAVAGTTLNKVGRTTGWSSGQVTNTCVNTGVSKSRVVRLCQDFVAAQVGSGDSGSPVFKDNGGSNVALAGILWGGNSAGTSFVASPLSNVEAELGALQTY